MTCVNKIAFFLHKSVTDDPHCSFSKVNRSFETSSLCQCEHCAFPFGGRRQRSILLCFARVTSAGDMSVLQKWHACVSRQNGIH